MHLRNISLPCCVCCGNLSQVAGWIDTVKNTAAFDGIMLDNLDAPWSSWQPLHKDGLKEMYIPTAKLVRAAGLDVWANGPHISVNGTREASTSAWQEYLEVSSFTTLFEIALDPWLKYPPVNFSKNFGWPPSKLGGYVLDIPDNTTAAKTAITASLKAGAERGLKWMYPTIACKHGTGPHQGSCTYADLPSYWRTWHRRLVHFVFGFNSRTLMGAPTP